MTDNMKNYLNSYVGHGPLDITPIGGHVFMAMSASEPRVSFLLYPAWMVSGVQKGWEERYSELRAKNVELMDEVARLREQSTQEKEVIRRKDEAILSYKEQNERLIHNMEENKRFYKDELAKLVKRINSVEAKNIKLLKQVEAKK